MLNGLNLVNKVSNYYFTDKKLSIQCKIWFENNLFYILMHFTDWCLRVLASAGHLVHFMLALVLVKEPCGQLVQWFDVSLKYIPGEQATKTKINVR